MDVMKSCWRLLSSRWNLSHWPVFIKSMEKSQGLKNQHFRKCQEACRKEVERAFGVLQARWRTINTPCRLWSSESMAIVMKSCIILHNTIVEDQRNDTTSYSGMLIFSVQTTSPVKSRYSMWQGLQYGTAVGDVLCRPNPKEKELSRNIASRLTTTFCMSTSHNRYAFCVSLYPIIT